MYQVSGSRSIRTIKSLIAAHRLTVKAIEVFGHHTGEVEVLSNPLLDKKEKTLLEKEYKARQELIRAPVFNFEEVNKKASYLIKLIMEQSDSIEPEDMLTILISFSNIKRHSSPEIDQEDI